MSPFRSTQRCPAGRETPRRRPGCPLNGWGVRSTGQWSWAIDDLVSAVPVARWGPSFSTSGPRCVPVRARDPASTSIGCPGGVASGRSGLRRLRWTGDGMNARRKGRLGGHRSWPSPADPPRAMASPVALHGVGRRWPPESLTMRHRLWECGEGAERCGRLWAEVTAETPRMISLGRSRAVSADRSGGAAYQSIVWAST